MSRRRFMMYYIMTLLSASDTSGEEGTDNEGEEE